ncbi:hypothetical protein KJ693_08290 [bacterium]|nr:hypothetical protein [bacterium]MBU1615298.1 hypothetical protein [bacterium]
MLVKRLNIELPGDQYEFLKQESTTRRVSVTGILRELIESYRFSKKTQRVDVEKDPLFKLGASFDSGAGDLSERHDDYLYGDRK